MCIRSFRLALMALLATISVAPLTGWAELPDHGIWNRLLDEHVVAADNGAVTTVDYAALRNQEAELDRYLGQLSAVSRVEFDQSPAPAQLAFLINSYNAWTVKLILSGDPDIESIKDLGNWLRSPWQKVFIPLFGETHSLDDIEHGMIRGSDRYDDPRIHFAINCASIGCPALRGEAYSAAQLDQQLEDQTRLFLQDRDRNRLQGDTLQLSPLFDWYRDDFAQGWRGQRSLQDFLAQYAVALGLDRNATLRLQNGDIGIEYLDYDWRLNRATQN